MFVSIAAQITTARSGPPEPESSQGVMVAPAFELWLLFSAPDTVTGERLGRSL
jgi:hypothetical protein